MQTFTANEAKTRFGEFLDRVQREPVRVMRHDRTVGVMVSAQDYEAMRAFYANRLQHTLDEAAGTVERFLARQAMVPIICPALIPVLRFMTDPS